ncbi:MAG: phosphohydrolase [Candidatus Magasanikbacteria bacterium CG10_big_fil_rev_8_21_14_0_10_40_10]|uniref:Phosphohydrolase n=1 Tax=Candidatus Magasanikbacteria bacterium CG10_big_fil_rev_8_21_14_0_10_40_10 TaxID=1974648 RepID=A0A2M6W4H6_9BACT|nr:MAG: phosphohydrolase [Candidatus Magasanikbacteria bacterium CG10_big_fil_rev_8_21_14_0_10_40_10]
MLNANQKQLLERTANYVKLKFLHDPTDRGWHHITRVGRLARVLQAQEGGDLFLIELTVLLHDVGDYKKYGFNESKGNLVLDAMMDILGINQDLQKKVMKLVSESQYKGKETKVPTTIEGKIIQDSDWLDGLGAIGIARTFAIGGNLGRALHDPARKIRPILSRHDYQKKKFESTSFNFFYEKSLKLPNMMNTKTGREMAKKRAEFIKIYLNEFVREWNLEDVPKLEGAKK